jgi:hypothetical protein
VAWLHELFELTSLGRESLRAKGLTAIEEVALGLLTRAPTQLYEEYISRIAHAPGRPGELARMLKLADSTTTSVIPGSRSERDRMRGHAAVSWNSTILSRRRRWRTDRDSSHGASSGGQAVRCTRREP